MNGNLAGLRLKYDALDTDDITDIQLLECLVGFFAHAVTCNVALNAALKILHIAEGCFTHDTFGHHTSCNPHGLGFQFFKIILDLCAVVGYVVFRDLKRILSVCLKLSQLLAAYLQKLLGVYCLFLLLFCQFSHSFSSIRFYQMMLGLEKGVPN